MQNPIPKLRQRSIITKKPGFFVWKLWRVPTTIEFDIFCWNFAHVFYLILSKKDCSGFFFILFRSWVTNKNVKNEYVETMSF